MNLKRARIREDSQKKAVFSHSLFLAFVLWFALKALYGQPYYTQLLRFMHIVFTPRIYHGYI